MDRRRKEGLYLSKHVLPRCDVTAGGPGSHFAYSPAALHGHSVYNMSQPGMLSPCMYAGGYSGGYSGGCYPQEGLPGRQQGFIEVVGYGQPMRAYR